MGRVITLVLVLQHLFENSSKLILKIGDPFKSNQNLRLLLFTGNAYPSKPKIDGVVGCQKTKSR